MSASTNRKLKILMAHGYTSNKFMFAKRTGAIRRACRDVADFTFINGPILVQPITSTGDLDAPETEEGNVIDENTPLEEQPRAWWRSNDDGEYLEWDKSVAYINEVLAKEGPFDAFWGFSQGGCLAGIIAAGFENPKNMPGLKLPPGQGPLRFAIAVSGFRSRDPVHQLLFKQPVQTPVLHVLGRADQIVDLERSQTLVDVCANSRVELHDGGHSVPSQAPWRNFFRDFIASFSSEPYKPNNDWKTVVGPSERPKGETPVATPQASGTTTPTTQEGTGETDVDPSNPARVVPRKKANQPFLVHQKWKAQQEAKKRANPSSDGSSNDVDVSAPLSAIGGLFKMAIIGLLIALAAGHFVTGDVLWGYRGKWTKLSTYLPRRERIFSQHELAMYNGRDPTKPIYLAILGDVYDVSPSPHIYGPDGSYSFFSGRDASRAYVTGCFKTHLTHDVRDFDDLQYQQLLAWKSFFDNSPKYDKIGRVVLPPLDPNDPVPPPCEDAMPQAGSS